MERRSQALAAAGLALLLSLSALGCGDDTKLSPQEEQAFKQSLDNGKGEFDINKVPPEHRERVRAIMEANKSAPDRSAPKKEGQ